MRCEAVRHPSHPIQKLVFYELIDILYYDQTNMSSISFQCNKGTQNHNGKTLDEKENRRLVSCLLVQNHVH